MISNIYDFEHQVNGVDFLVGLPRFFCHVFLHERKSLTVYFCIATCRSGPSTLAITHIDFQRSTAQVNEPAYMINLSHPCSLMLSCNGSIATYTSPMQNGIPDVDSLSPCKMELEGSTVQVNEVAYMIGLLHPRGLLLSYNGSTA